MIEVEYKRSGTLRSKLLYFADELPSMEGYHFVVCEDCRSKLPFPPQIPCIKNTTTIIDLTKDVDTLFRQMHRNRRNIVKRGLKRGYQITPKEPTIDQLRKFRKFYNAFIPRKGATPIVTLNTYEALMPYMTIFYGKYQGVNLQTMLLLHDGNIVKMFRYVRDEDFKDRDVLNDIGSTMEWEVMLHFKRLGYQTFDLGGLSVGPSIQKFKLSFGGEIIPYYTYEVALTPAARTVMKLIKIIERIVKALFRDEHVISKKAHELGKV